MPECYADTLLVSTLVPPLKRYNHKHSCFLVEKEMVKGKLKDSFAVGIIDRDKRKIKYLKEFEVIDKVENYLYLLRHNRKEKHHFIIQLIPALEQWILNICTAEKIDFVNLPRDLSEFKKYTKKQSSLENDDLRNLYLKMSEKDSNPAIRKLKSWLRLLKEKNYHADLNELRNAGQ